MNWLNDGDCATGLRCNSPIERLAESGPMALADSELLAILLGFLGVAHSAGEAWAERQYNGGEWFSRANSYYFMAAGLALMSALFIAANVITMAGPWLGFLNNILSQARPVYLEDLLHYRRALRQRNELRARARDALLTEALAVEEEIEEHKPAEDLLELEGDGRPGLTLTGLQAMQDPPRSTAATSARS